MTKVQAIIQPETETALDVALAALAGGFVILETTLSDTSAAIADGAEASAIVKVAKRSLSWLIFDAVQVTSETAREAFLEDQAKRLSLVLAEKDGATRKTLEGFRKGCILYVDVLRRMTPEERGKRDVVSAGRAAHAAAEKERAKREERQQYGKRATALAAQHMGMDVDDFRDLLEDGDAAAHETKARFIAVLKNNGSFVTHVTEGWNAASAEARAEVRRYMLANLTDEEKAAFVAALTA